MQRNYKIDNIRALAILIVVLGHSIIIYSSEWNLYSSTTVVPALDLVKKAINIVQMPMFFSLSGFLFHAKADITSYQNLLKTKTARLLVPYISIAVIWMVPIKMLVKYPAYNGRSFIDIIVFDILLYGDNGHLWYLPCLFMCFFLYKFLSNISRNKGFIFVIWCFAILASFFIDKTTFGDAARLFYFLFKWFAWFVFGGLLSTVMQDTNKKSDVFFCIGCIVFSFLAIIKPNSIIILLARITILYVLYRYIPNKNNKYTLFLSKNSLGVYLLHSPLIYITFTFLSNSVPVAVVALNFIAFGSLSLVISYLLSKTKGAFLIGGKIHK